MRISGDNEVLNPPPIKPLIQPFEVVDLRGRGCLALKPDFRFLQPSGLPFALLPTPIGVRPRGQKCTFIQISFQPSACRTALLGGVFYRPAAQRTAIALPIAISGALGNQFKPFSPALSAEEAHQGGEAASSCRPCLIACNSRPGDEVGGEP